MRSAVSGGQPFSTSSTARCRSMSCARGQPCGPLGGVPGPLERLGAPALDALVLGSLIGISVAGIGGVVLSHHFGKTGKTV